MEIPLNFIYLLATFPPLIIWIILFSLRKDLRKEMWVMSIFMGVLSVVTSYFWWTIDWWQPPTIWATRVGIEDFLAGFASGGIMAAIYEVIFKKRLYKRKSDHHKARSLIIFILSAQITVWLFWGIGATSFVISTLTMIVISAIVLLARRDLFFNALGSGILMLLASVPSYYLVLLIHPKWIDVTYSMLSGIRITGIPIEEFAFWFLAGFLFGPFYEFWQGARLRKIRS